jgi:CRISPR locus-related DNA-binding protein
MAKRKVMLIPVGEQIAPLLHGFRYFNEIDDVVLLFSEETKGQADKMNSYLEKMEIVKRIIKIKCRAEDLISILEELVMKFKEMYQNEEIELIANITGGTKVMSLACFIFSSIMNGKSFYIFKTKDSMKFLQIPNMNLKFVKVLKTSKTRQQLIDILEKSDNLRLKDLSKMLNKSKATLAYYLNEFIENGLIERKDNKYSITEMGRFISLILKSKIEI